MVRQIYLTDRFFILWGAVIALCAFSFAYAQLYVFSLVVLGVILLLSLYEIFVLFAKQKPVDTQRFLPHLLSLGDDNKISLNIENHTGWKLFISLVDELPFQFQIRNFLLNFEIPPYEKKHLSYMQRPLMRGNYVFGAANLYISTFLGLIQRRVACEANQVTAVYPSIIQMKKYEIRSMPKISNFYGVKKMRRIGHSYEFETIKNYVQGDDFRSINWKATGRRNSLMVNQYEDEKSQQIYSVLDKSRSMQLCFNGLTLLDYSINTSLVIANNVLQKQDKAGLITFSNKIDTTVKADKGTTQLKRILESLYKEEESNLEADYELLFLALKHVVTSRSLLFLYSNFESFYSLQRVLPVLRKINQMHLLVVMFFENTEVKNFGREEPVNMKDMYAKTFAEEFVYEKQMIQQELKRYGIMSILSKPEDLSINTVNKYLEIKAKGLI